MFFLKALSYLQSGYEDLLEESAFNMELVCSIYKNGTVQRMEQLKGEERRPQRMKAVSCYSREGNVESKKLGFLTAGWAVEQDKTEENTDFILCIA